MPSTVRDLTFGIKSVETSAQSLCHRAQAAGVEFAKVATALAELQGAITRLRIAMDDPSGLPSMLPWPCEMATCLLTSLTMNCEINLVHLAIMLEKRGLTGYGSKTKAKAQARGKDMVALIRTKFAHQKADIDTFLYVVQQHSNARIKGAEIDDDQAAVIRARVTAIAAQTAHRHSKVEVCTCIEAKLWQYFFMELIGEEASPDADQRNKVRLSNAHYYGPDVGGLLLN
ncbi:hypothetical protein HIM_06478 [Hirsutella minnesotensis 3608]|uniref:Fungal N-terminal domain-containing protein n=1 Tax=Hirsutella minnesotensis 3608 TaxID=1043627 RepID=A0A0F8A4R3_9HYPO|nr:hypothetical protein HIM_06478 [Hirsutella minnesotensis 3608]